MGWACESDNEHSSSLETIEDENTTLLRNVRTRLQLTRCLTPEERMPRLHGS